MKRSSIINISDTVKMFSWESKHKTKMLKIILKLKSLCFYICHIFIIYENINCHNMYDNMNI